MENNNISATQLLSAGYTPVCVVPPNVTVASRSSIYGKPTGKIPGLRLNDGCWTGYNWSDHCPVEDEVKNWDQWDANVGINARYNPAFDIDVDDKSLCEGIVKIITLICGETCQRDSKPPRTLLWYRASTPIKKQRLEFTYQQQTHAVELLGDGQQFVVKGTHPEGHAYMVKDFLDHNELSEIDTDTIAFILRKITGYIVESGGQILGKSEAIAEENKSTQPHQDISKVDLSDGEIGEILNRINPDIYYSDWIKVGQGLHAQYEGGSVGLALWTDWSSGGKKFKKGECVEKWKTFQLSPEGVSFKTVISMSRNLVSRHQEKTVATLSTATPSTNIVRPKSVADLMKRTIPPRKWLIDGLLPEGCCILAAHPKVGKSWLALQLCKHVTTGEDIFGRKVAQGNTLYLALEDDDLRIQDRLRKLDIENTGDVNFMQYQTDWPREGKGGIEALEEWFKTTADPKLVVIDTLEKFRLERKANVNQYGQDYGAFANLKKLSQEYRACILLIHHFKKGAAKVDDDMEAFSGSMGTTAAVDTLLSLKKHQRGPAELTSRGRDVATQESLMINFDKELCWVLTDAPKTSNQSNTEEKIMSLFAEEGQLKASEIVERTGLNPSTVRGVLASLQEKGRLHRIMRGNYSANIQQTNI